MVVGEKGGMKILDTPPPPPPTAVPLPRKRGRITRGAFSSSPAKRGRGTMRSMVEGALLLLLFLFIAAPASAAKIDDQFRAWLEQDLWPEAKANGVSKKTFDAAFGGVTPNLELPDLVLPGEK